MPPNTKLFLRGCRYDLKGLRTQTKKLPVCIFQIVLDAHTLEFSFEI